ncbi:hypothetical protein OAM67_00630 [bacterium]|nr:hypothetical protein [bacterium]
MTEHCHINVLLNGEVHKLNCMENETFDQIRRELGIKTPARYYVNGIEVHSQRMVGQTFARGGSLVHIAPLTINMAAIDATQPNQSEQFEQSEQPVISPPTHTRRCKKERKEQRKEQRREQRREQRKKEHAKERVKECNKPYKKPRKQTSKVLKVGPKNVSDFKQSPPFPTKDHQPPSVTENQSAPVCIPPLDDELDLEAQNINTETVQNNNTENMENVTNAGIKHGNTNNAKRGEQLRLRRDALFETYCLLDKACVETDDPLRAAQQADYDAQCRLGTAKTQRSTLTKLHFVLLDCDKLYSDVTSLSNRLFSAKMAPNVMGHMYKTNVWPADIAPRLHQLGLFDDVMKLDTKFDLVCELCNCSKIVKFVETKAALFDAELEVSRAYAADTSAAFSAMVKKRDNLRADRHNVLKRLKNANARLACWNIEQRKVAQAELRAQNEKQEREMLAKQQQMEQEQEKKRLMKLVDSELIARRIEIADTEHALKNNANPTEDIIRSLKEIQQRLTNVEGQFKALERSAFYGRFCGMQV